MWLGAEELSECQQHFTSCALNLFVVYDITWDSDDPDLQALCALSRQ